MSIIDLIFPKTCVGCKKEGEYICLDCRKKLVIPAPICPTCCKPSIGGWVHPRCGENCSIDRLFVSLPYRGIVQNCLKKVKYRSAWDILDFLYKLHTLDLESQEWLVTSVPMWDKKERERGFNQASILAELTAKQLNATSINTLRRVRETKPMFGLKKVDRKENVQGAFQFNYKSKTNLAARQVLQFSNQKVILVDDVWTTGATMRECATVLKRAGINEIWGIALAR